MQEVDDQINNVLEFSSDKDGIEVNSKEMKFWQE
jgi:hypothetical protein